jgi:hypothetical protein
MFNNYAFQNHHSLKSDHDVMATSGAQPRQAIVQSSPAGGFHDSTSPNTVMTLCLTPFCIAFVLFAIHLVKYSIRLNRCVKRLEHVAILERALCKAPDECS